MMQQTLEQACSQGMLHVEHQTEKQVGHESVLAVGQDVQTTLMSKVQLEGLQSS